MTAPEAAPDADVQTYRTAALRYIDGGSRDPIGAIRAGLDAVFPDVVRRALDQPGPPTGPAPVSGLLEYAEVGTLAEVNRLAGQGWALLGPPVFTQFSDDDRGLTYTLHRPRGVG